MLWALYLRNLCLTQGHEDFLLGAIDISIYDDPFWVNFCKWYEMQIKVHFFGLWISQCALNICWKNYHFSTALLCTFVKNQLSINESNFRLLILKFHWCLCLSLLHCPYYCNFIISLEIKWCKFFNFAFLLQSCFDYSKSSAFPYEFQNQLVHFYRKSAEILIRITLNLQINLVRINTLKILSLLTDIENKLVVTSGEREVGRSNIGVGGKRVIMGLYEIMHVKLLKIVKHYRI